MNTAANSIQVSDYISKTLKPGEIDIPQELAADIRSTILPSIVNAIPKGFGFSIGRERERFEFTHYISVAPKKMFDINQMFNMRICYYGGWTTLRITFKRPFGFEYDSGLEKMTFRNNSWKVEKPSSFIFKKMIETKCRGSSVILEEEFTQSLALITAICSGHMWENKRQALINIFNRPDHRSKFKDLEFETKISILDYADSLHKSPSP
jgi:hypothetical protein